MASDGSCKPYLAISTLPDISKAEMDFLDSFFQSDQFPRPQLPTPASIIHNHPTIKELNMVVKINHASYLRLEEAQAMCAIRQVFPNGEVPVPEVFGWRRHGNQVFLYMSLIHGPTLREAWPSLTEDDKLSIRNQLGQIVASLRRITQHSPNTIASVNGGTVQDRFFMTDYEEGLFRTIKSFNDWLFAAATRQRPGPDGIIPGLDHPHMYRDLISDTGRVYFTHGDLTLGNIMAGWYPEYWEYCKMMYGVELDHEWRTEDWPDKIVQPFEDTLFAFAEYSLWRCP
ncbi:phosphotransferase enzyme family protein [Trichoderma austrokoningii]